ncbi:MAG: response regulator transcription factor [Chloroflexi bacterium]|nr:MAG: response regulator transcription factor [Chloroflexota bacterium]
MAESSATEPSSNDRPRVVVIDDRTMPRIAVRAMLDSTGTFELVGEAASGEEGVRLCQRVHPELVLLDVDMPGMDGAATARAILGNQGPHPIIVAWTVSDSGEDLIRMIRAGCAGYALKDSGPKELDRALMTAFHGDMPVPRKMIPEVITRAVARQERPAGAPPALSPREREVLRLAAHGLSTKEIAKDLTISRRSVDAHFSNIYRKLDVVNRGQAVHHALLQGLIGADEM